MGVGYDQGTPNITNEVELGLEFVGFWQNFISTFGMEGYTTYITGKSTKRPLSSEMWHLVT